MNRFSSCKFPRSVPLLLGPVAVFFTFMAAPGCNESGRHDTPAGNPSDKSPSLEMDPDYKGKETLKFQAVELSLCPDSGTPNPALRRLLKGSRIANQHLRRASCHTIQGFSRSDRSIFQLPEALGQGRALELVMRRGRGPVALVDRSAKRFWWGSPSHMLDILESAPHRPRSKASARFLDAKSDPEVKWNNQPTTRLDVVVEYQREAIGQKKPREVRMDLVVWFAPSERESKKLGRMLMNLSLLSLGGAHGWRSLDAIKKKIGFPVRWRVSIRSREWPAEREAVTFSYSVIPRPNGDLWTSAHLPSHRGALPPAESQRRFGPLGGLDRQEVPKKLLKPLRPPLGIPTETRIGSLILGNDTSRAAVVTLDGFRLGLVSPGTRHVFTGIPAGYYRVAAHSPWGSTSHGPHDMYIGGKWTLR